jgi:hypothetical protein
VKLDRPSAFADAQPLDRRGKRSPATLLVIDERDRYLRFAARHFFTGVSDREAARMLRLRLSIYREGRWRRDRIELKCPLRLVGYLEATLWALLKTKDGLPSARLIRAVIARS